MEWKPISKIPGYEAFTDFILNIQGELRNTKTGTTLKWCPTKKKEDGSPAGYMRAELNQKPAKPKKINQHRAICCLFKPNPLNLPTVDHIDKNGLNNHIDNLRWATHIEQMHNRGMMSTNTSGEENIFQVFNNGKPAWRVDMMFKCRRTSKTFPRDETSNVIPQEAIDWRNKMQLEIETELQNERNNLILTRL